MKAIEFHNQLLDFEVSLKKFAYQLTLKKSDAKDLLQDTFLKVLTNQDKFVYNDNFKAWTFKIMKNTFINNYRRNFQKNNYVDLTNETFIVNKTKFTGYEDPDSTYSVMEINQNIEKLKDKFRIPFTMLINGYKYKEIADQLNLNIGTVKSRIFLSRKLLMEKLNS